MADTVRASNVWSLHGTTSRLSSGALNGELDIARPDIGLRQPQFDCDSLPCAFLAVMRSAEQINRGAARAHEKKNRWPLQVADSYVRGNDLIASYQPNDTWPYAPQIYWQARSTSQTTPALASMTLLVSLQTQLLDTHPRITVASQVPCRELQVITLTKGESPVAELIKSNQTFDATVAGCCVVRRLTAAPLSYIEYMPPTDFQQLSCGSDPGGNAFAEWQLFSEFLEKGVIQRARVHAALLPKENDIELAIKCCSLFVSSPLPLTA